jgi:hypothetical protein
MEADRASALANLAPEHLRTVEHLRGVQQLTKVRRLVLPFPPPFALFGLTPRLPLDSQGSMNQAHASATSSATSLMPELAPLQSLKDTMAIGSSDPRRGGAALNAKQQGQMMSLMGQAERALLKQITRDEFEQQIVRRFREEKMRKLEQRLASGDMLDSGRQAALDNIEAVIAQKRAVFDEVHAAGGAAGAGGPSPAGEAYMDAGNLRSAAPPKP